MSKTKTVWQVYRLILMTSGRYMKVHGDPKAGINFHLTWMYVSAACT